MVHGSLPSLVSPRGGVLGVLAREALPGGGRGRVVGASRRGGRELFADQRLEPIAQVPALGEHDQPGPVAVEAAVVREHRGHLPRVVVELGLAPRAGDHEHGRDAPELGRDLLVDARRPRLLPLGPGRARAPDDGVVRCRRSGDVDGGDRVVIGQVLADRDPAVADPQGVDLDEGGEGFGDDRAERLVDGVHLQDAHLVVDDQLVQHVHRRDRALVARSEHDAHPAGTRAPGRLVAVQLPLARLLAGLDPDVAGHAGKQGPIEQRLREGARDPLPVGALPGLGQGRLPVRLERLGEQPQVAHRPRACPPGIPPRGPRCLRRSP